MNIIEFTEKFHTIETDNNFFQEKDDEGILYWDLVRYDVFYLLYRHVCNTELLKVENNSISKWSMLSSFFKNSIGLIKFKFISSKKFKYICFTASRNNGNDQNSIDIISDDILSEIKKDTLAIESFSKDNNKSDYVKIFDFGFLFEAYKHALKRKLGIKKNFTYKVCDILQKEIADVSLHSHIEKIISNYKIGNSYYKKLLKRISPETIFVVQNGIRKDLFAAANQLNIPVVELQHGLIGYVHLGYSYPKNFNSLNLETLPSVFFSFSDFWTNSTNYPVKTKIPVGNNFYAKRILDSKKQYDITFVFANIYTKDLIAFIDSLLKEDYKGRICIKLHPNQFSEFEIISSLFHNYSNIEVISNKKTISQILSVSKSIFAVQSTVVYEALHYNVKVYLYKIKDYLTHNDIINNPNVYVVKNASEVQVYDSYSFKKSEEDTIFSPFNKEVFNRFLDRRP